MQNNGPGAETIDLVQLWNALCAKRRFIALTSLTTLTIVMVVTVLSPMQFSSSGRLYLGELESSNRASHSALDSMSGSHGDIASEVEILSSRSLAENAILAAGLNVTIRPKGWTPPRFFGWRLSGRDPDTIDVGLQSLRATETKLTSRSDVPLALEVRFIDATTYRVEGKDGLSLVGTLGTALALPNASLTLLEGFARRPEPGAVYEVDIHPLDTLVTDFLGRLKVSSAKGSGTDVPKVIMLQFQDHSPYVAAKFVEHMLSTYLEQRHAWKVENATAAEDFVRQQLDSIRASLDDTEVKLAHFRAKNPVVLDANATAMMRQLGVYEQQRMHAKLEAASLGEMMKGLESPEPDPEAHLVGEGTDMVLRELARSLSENSRRLADLRERFGDDAPPVQELRTLVKADRKMIREYLTKRHARAQENLKVVSEIIAQFEEKLKSIPGAELGLAQLARESDVYSRLYSFLLERQQQEAIAKASTVSKNRVLDPPLIQYREDAPKVGLRAVSALLGLLLGAVIVLLQRAFAGTLQDEEDARAVVGDVPVFAAVPTGEEDLIQRDNHAMSAIEAVCDGDSNFSEAFRLLRTRLYFSCGFSGGKVVVLTSPTPGDGKTTAAFALASMLALDGKQVLLIEADLRKPSHDALLGREPDLGLRGILAGRVAWPAAVHLVQVGAESFSSIGAGRIGPAELLSSSRLGSFLSEARSSFDFILLDGPSFPVVSDPLVLAAEADVVLSVLRIQVTPRKMAQQHLAGLCPSSRIHAVVLNGTTPVLPYGYGHPPEGLPKRQRGFSLSRKHLVDWRRARRALLLRWGRRRKDGSASPLPERD